MASVEKILRELGLDKKLQILVFNKIDRLAVEEVENLKMRFNAIAISAIDPSTLGPLLRAIEEHIWNSKTSLVTV